MTENCDLLIVNGRVVDLDAVSLGTQVAVRDGTIVEVGDDTLRDRWQPRHVVDAHGGLVAPGFVDAHVHLSAYLGRALPYRRSVEPGVFAGAGRTAEIIPMIVQLCSMPVPPELTAAVLRPVMAAMLRAGITGVVDAGSSGLDGLVTAATETGIRIAIGPSLADTWHDPAGVIERRADTDALLADASAWIDRNDGAADGRVRSIVSAIEPIAASDELLAGIARLAGAERPVHVHSHISPTSVADHIRHYQRTNTERLAAAGLLHPGCTLMHAATLTDADVTTFAATGVTVNYNPLGNAMLGFGLASGNALARLQAAGVPIVLGSDYAPSMIATPFDMIHAALVVQRELAANDAALTLEDALAMTWNGGASLGQPGRLGRVAAGQLADLVIIDTDGSHHLGDPHPAPALALRAISSDVRTVIVNGTVVVNNHQLLTIDEHDAITQARAAFREVAEHAPK